MIERRRFFLLLRLLDMMMSSRPLPEIKIDDQCPICTEPLCSLTESDRRMLFICNQCKNSWIHFSCAKSLVKIDRVESRLPLKCPFCRRPYSKEELSPLLPQRRKMTFGFCAQPIDENSIFEIKVVEYYNDRSYVPDNPFQQQQQQDNNNNNEFRGRREALTCRFDGSHFPETNQIYFPVRATQKIVPQQPPPHSLPGCLFIPVVLPESPRQQQQPSLESSSSPPTNLVVMEEEEEEEEEGRRGEADQQQRLISPVRRVIRNHIMAEKALEDLRKSICEIQITNNHRMITRSMSRRNNRRRRRNPLDKMKTRVKIIRKLCSGLNSDLIDFLMSSC